MRPTAAARPPLELTDDVLRLRAWRMPDMVAYQHSSDEWWVAPLDDNLPLVRLNRAGFELLTSMDGHTTVASLLNKFGGWVCGPDGENGRLSLERWSLPNYSLCYFGTEPPGGHRHKAKWDILLQEIREGWSGQEGFEGEDHLQDYHVHELKESDQDDGHFDLIETTVSHLFREPSEALGGLTYGRQLMRQFRQFGWFQPKPTTIVEVGGGLGYVACELGKELLPFEKQGIAYVTLDVTRPFLTRQVNRARQGGWRCQGTQANGEWLPLKTSSVDLLIDNENMADMTPVQLRGQEIREGKGDTPQHQEALDWIRRIRLPLDAEVPESAMFNLGPIRFLAEVWRVLKPGGRAILVEFGIEEGWPAPVKLPGHTEYEVQYSHLRHAARWLGFEEQYLTLPQLLLINPKTRVLCTGAVYTIQRFCEALGKPFTIRAYTEAELSNSLGDMLPKLMGCHYHDVIDPAWFGLWDFKVMLLRKPGGTAQPKMTEAKGYRWYSQK